MYLKWLRLNYFYLVIAALLGLFMRADVGAFISIPYNNILHTHSHIAFLGWVYPTLFILLINKFLTKEKRALFKWQLIGTHVLIMAMLVAFIMQGYGFYSILFSSLFQLFNYWFIFSFWRSLKKSPGINPVPLIFVKIALLSLFISTIGPWTLGGIIATSGSKSHFYNMAIYFYLHFQYNGWILFALFALFFRQLNIQSSTKGIKHVLNFLTYISFALLPGYCLSLLNIFHTAWNFSLAALSAILQLTALYNLMRFLWLNRDWHFFNIKGWPQKTLALCVLLAFALKIMLQLLSIIPALTEFAFNNHNIIIAFLHLTMLGVITAYLILVLAQNNLLPIDSLLAKIALLLFLSGFIVTEILLGFQFTGFIMYTFRDVLIIFTTILFAGIFLLMPAFLKGKNYEH